MLKLAIVRGTNLNKFEMQCYEPLAKHFNIMAYYSNNPHSDVSKIAIPKKELKSWACALGKSASKLIKYPFSAIGCKESMIGLIDELKAYDLVNTAETFNSYSYQAIKAKEKYGIKVVVTCWETVPFRCESRIARARIKEKVRNNADLFIAVTERVKDALLIEGIPENKITVIPSGVDTTTFKPGKKNEALMKKLSLKKDDFVVLFIGRFVWEKGVYDLIYAAKKMAMDHELSQKPVKFIFVGSGPEERKMREIIGKLGVEKTVILAGAYPYDEMNIIHNLADVFILPSISLKEWNEQFGWVLVEAMASGTPIIASGSGSIPEVVGGAGIIIPPNDPAAICREVKKMISNDALREKYGKLGRIRAESVFDANVVASRLKREFEHMVR